MAVNTITDFRTNFFGIRPNRFKVRGTYPVGGGSSDKFDVYIKAADLPTSTIGPIPVTWQGRIVKFSGERVYTDWAISVYDSSIDSHSLRVNLERWIEEMDGRNSHKINYNLTSTWSVEYNDMSNAIGDGSFNNTIYLINCFPVEIGPVQLNYDLSDTFSEFTVVLAYDYWTPNDPGNRTSSPVIGSDSPENINGGGIIPGAVVASNFNNSTTNTSNSSNASA